MRKLNVLAATVTTSVAGALLFVGVGTAQAHQTCLNHGSDWGCVSTDHRTISAHDEECDGNFVWAQYVNGAGQWFTVTDANGCAAGGNYHNVPSGVVQYRLCEGNVGCTGFRYT